jgi:hypothetical protein
MVKKCWQPWVDRIALPVLGVGCQDGGRPQSTSTGSSTNWVLEFSFGSHGVSDLGATFSQH